MFSIGTVLSRPIARFGRASLGTFVAALAAALIWMGASPRIASADNCSGAGDPAQCRLDALAACLQVHDVSYGMTTRTDKRIVIYDCTLVVQSGSTISTGTGGLGNLIVGHSDDDSGSNNAVIGDLHNFTSYGGLVAGEDNVASASFATVAGGRENEASASWSVVAGGRLNSTNNGHTSSILGGYSNDTSNGYAAVVGGRQSTASGAYASVVGGWRNTASGDYSAVLGGGGDTAGEGNTASGDYSTVAGGQTNTASGDTSHVAAGVNNTASGEFSAALGGGDTTSGFGNTAGMKYGVVVGGKGNKTTAGGSVPNAAVVVGGVCNETKSGASVIVGGGGPEDGMATDCTDSRGNLIDVGTTTPESDAVRAVIVGGQTNLLDGDGDGGEGSVILGGSSTEYTPGSGYPNRTVVGTEGAVLYHDTDSDTVLGHTVP